MDPLALGEAVAGGALVFFVPGYAVAKAVFPERRISAPGGRRWAVEVVTLGIVLSVVLTVVVGELLLAGAPGGFSASWTDPLLEASLAAVAVVAFAIGGLEGAYSRTPRTARPPPEDDGEDGAWELSDRLDRLQRERLHLDRELRHTPATDAAAVARLRQHRDEVVAEEATLRRRREEEYDR